MRSIHFLLIAGLFLPLGACGGPAENRAPPPLNKDLLVGTWITEQKTQLIQKLEIAAGGSLKATFKDVAEAVPGTYTWSDDRALTVAFRPSDAAKNEYKEMAKKLQAEIKESVTRRAGEANGANAAAAIPDEVPATENMHVNLSEDQLILTTEKELKLPFNRAK
jgi:hypothetical protein